MKLRGAIVNGEFEIVEETWERPLVTPELKQMAIAALPGLERNAQPTTIERRQAWLVGIAQVVAGRLSNEEATSRIVIYADLLDDIPAGILTRDLRKRVAKAFKWFPSFAELSEIIDAEAKAYRDLVIRCRTIAEAQALVAKQGA